MTEKDASIFKMKLHEEINIGQYQVVMRVPGGWIYMLPNGEEYTAHVFVPFSTEFSSALHKHPSLTLKKGN